MNNINHIIILSLVFLSANSLRLFMIGGHSFDSPFFFDLAAAVPGREPTPGQCLDDWNITKCPRIAVITSSHETEAQGNDTYSLDDEVGPSYQHIFQGFGMAPAHISVHTDNRQQTNSLLTPRGMANLQIIQAADILYFTGGDQSKHVRAWLNDDGSDSPLLEVVRKRAFSDEIIVSGSSAGSMVYADQTYGYGSPYGVLYFANSVGLAPKTISDADVNGTNLSDDRNGTNCLQYDENAGRMPGFRWTSIIFDTHFNVWGRMGRIAPFLVGLQRPIAVGLDENTSLFYENGQGKVYGEHGVTIVDISDAIRLSGKYFRMQNVKVHYLTEGDKYEFKSKTITSSKPPITTPQFKNSTDSDDIFDSYEASLLLTRLVDQTAVYNRGRSVIPDGYPEESPIFQLTFSKNAQTKGYRRGNAYTVVNAILDYSYSSAVAENLAKQQ